MGLFKCAKCGCAENTALGFYWLRNDPKTIESLDWSETGEEYKGKPLCSECAPRKYLDGKETGWGKWHGKFDKLPYDEETTGIKSMTKEETTLKHEIPDYMLMPYRIPECKLPVFETLTGKEKRRRRRELERQKKKRK